MCSKQQPKQQGIDEFIEELMNDKEWWDRYDALKSMLDKAKAGKNIEKYKFIHKCLTGNEVEIYTDQTKDRLIPLDCDKNKDAEFWFHR